jgi:hypothetical protein
VVLAVTPGGGGGGSDSPYDRNLLVVVTQTFLATSTAIYMRHVSPTLTPTAPLLSAAIAQRSYLPNALSQTVSIGPQALNLFLLHHSDNTTLLYHNQAPVYQVPHSNHSHVHLLQHCAPKRNGTLVLLAYTVVPPADQPRVAQATVLLLDLQWTSSVLLSQAELTVDFSGVTAPLLSNPPHIAPIAIDPFTCDLAIAYNSYPGSTFNCSGACTATLESYTHSTEVVRIVRLSESNVFVVQPAAAELVRESDYELQVPSGIFHPISGDLYMLVFTSWHIHFLGGTGYFTNFRREFPGVVLLRARAAMPVDAVLISEQTTKYSLNNDVPFRLQYNPFTDQVTLFGLSARVTAWQQSCSFDDTIIGSGTATGNLKLFATEINDYSAPCDCTGMHWAPANNSFASTAALVCC